MKRRELIRHLSDNGCFEVREGSRHSIWSNSRRDRRTAIPRHNEIGDLLAKKICRDLDVPDC